MTKTDGEKGEEILRKRRLAAKGLKEQPDGRAIDPMEDFDPLGESIADTDDAQVGRTKPAAVAGIVTRRSG